MNTCRVILTGGWCVSQAAYHGVPIVVLPFFADQHENADKAVGRVRMFPPSACMQAKSSTLPLPNISGMV
jgi:hypothetical protein